MNRMQEKYNNEVVPALRKAFDLKNVMQVPRIQKVVVNIGMGEAMDNPKAMEAAVSDLTIITGQKPVNMPEHLVHVFGRNLLRLERLNVRRGVGCLNLNQAVIINKAILTLATFGDPGRLTTSSKGYGFFVSKSGIQQFRIFNAQIEINVSLISPLSAYSLKPDDIGDLLYAPMRTITPRMAMFMFMTSWESKMRSFRRA